MTTGARTALDITTIADVEHSLVAMDSLLHRGETTPGLLASVWRATRSGPTHCTATSSSGWPTGARNPSGEIAHPLPVLGRDCLPPNPQYEIKDRAGRVSRTGRLRVAGDRVFLEFDGKEKYEKFRARASR